MTLDDPVTDRKAKPYSLHFLFGRKKGFKNLVSALFGNPHACVSDMDQDLILFSSCPNGKDSTLRHGLLRIFKHIEHHLPHLVRRSHHLRHLLVEVSLYLDIGFLHLFINHQKDSLQQFVQVDGSPHFLFGL